MVARISKKCECGCGLLVKRNSSRWYPGHGHADARIRFWRFVKKTSEKGCWVWVGANTGTARKGYGHGRFWAYGKIWMAPHFVLHLDGKRIPKGLFVLHKCDNPACVNPKHLYVGTHSQNMLDMYARCRVDRSGENHGLALLSWRYVRAIRRMYKRARAGNKCAVKRALAKKYGVSVPAIDAVVYNRTWKEK